MGFKDANTVSNRTLFVEYAKGASVQQVSNVLNANILIAPLKL